ncbi:gustatory receptor for sugar taste 43a-like [Musca vetustissima]|uniref:gustatory receptor for sugar taste 43a-like n=1 Tax=Musca vetustissima TaxID=27455 RepID=UPI002AB63EAA|nr:gustatory receptor for sugar taste 43a-like [Musca vetustissima]
MEISENSRCIYIVSKILGLAPFSVKKSEKGNYVVEKSIPFIIYAAVLASAMAFLTYRGLLFDANSKAPLRQSFRMKSITSKAVTSMDVSVIVMAVTAGVLCGIFGFSSTRELNVRLQKVDASINGGRKRETLKAIVLLMLPVLSISTLMWTLILTVHDSWISPMCVLLLSYCCQPTTLQPKDFEHSYYRELAAANSDKAAAIFFDIWTWLSFAEKENTEGENIDLNALWYIPFYGLYYILTCLHVSFANTALSLSRRFKSLNMTLKMSFLTTGLNDEPKKSNIPRITPVIPTKSNEPPLQISFTKIASEMYQTPEKNKSLLLKLLAECHDSLAKCVGLVSSSYGMAVLFILLSCFLHLVATSYFLFMELLEKNSGGIIWLQVLWITFHASRLLLVVEPCHRISAESSKTIHIICEIERGIHDSILAEEVKKFWQQQLVFKDRFSACGLVMVDRSLLTSIFSAIATYLVIIIQFQKSDG